MATRTSAARARRLLRSGRAGFAAVVENAHSPMRLPDLGQPSLLEHLTAYIGGEFLPFDKPSLVVSDPATQHTLAVLPSYGRVEADRAIEAAELCLRHAAPAPERQRWLVGIAEAHLAHADTLAQLITLENGKPRKEALAEVTYAAGFFADAATRLEALTPRQLPSPIKGCEWSIHHRPAGVAGLIVPWNFPLAMLAKKVSAALAAGAPVVIKPSEKTPLSTLAWAHLVHRLGLPVGMVNVLFGDAPAIGKAFCEHPAVRVISFTGSTQVGKLLALQAAPHVKRLALELGGNAPFVVFDDADVETAAHALLANKFRGAGQTCVCTNRVLVQRTISRRFIDRVRSLASTLRVGPGQDPKSDVGPLIDRAALDKVQRLVQNAMDQGARCILGGSKEAVEAGPGHFYPPTILEDVPVSAQCWREEIFGPVVTFTTFDTVEQALVLANDTQYGLAAYLFTGDVNLAERLTQALSFGHVAINTGNGPTPEAPFGGMKESGLGREGGLDGIMEYIELQTVAKSVPQ